ncbi:aspartate aminotransferase family protein [Agrobacterium tumefaciens]|uniref:Aspartate aminotransferase family protein n=1 Tax=Rhizobium rhizogenes TaxID=359 RepID=A0AA92BZS6_RHIRH|nr:aspartate aminotransferase family protein [Rhizobium rhizogenes]PVE62403.1 aspartate aminotransferase family protein [Agrobacterium tumefaciens]PVE70586.1 aspartate aminotransferase family protein [Sphingomonas sp. TPD3009]
MLNSLRSRDMAHHFHSQTNPRRHETDGPLMITKGQGCYVIDELGNRYLEGMGGLWCASLGFENERLADVAAAQMKKLATYHTFNHRSNDPCADVAEQVAELSPIPGSKVFLVNSGSEANDTMVKLAWYYNVARGKSAKRKIISRKGAFHGSTVMGAALSGLPHMHESFNLPGLNVIYAEKPHFYRNAEAGEDEEAYCNRLIADLESLIEAEGADTIAAMIAEPIMGAGGVVTPPAGYFPRVREVLTRHGILLLSDEVVCGFGRSGHWFGSQAYGFVPDMMSIAKGLSSGYMPIAAAVISDDLYQTIADEADRIGVFGHGFTYSGHPVTAAVAAEVLRTYREMDIPARAQALGRRLFGALEASLAGHEIVGEIRGAGFLAGIELVADKATRMPFDPALKVGALVERRCRAHGVMIRNMGDVISICPPFVMTESEVDQLVAGIAAALDDALSQLGR